MHFQLKAHRQVAISGRNIKSHGGNGKASISIFTSTTFEAVASASAMAAESEVTVPVDEILCCSCKQEKRIVHGDCGACYACCNCSKKKD